MLRCEYVGSAMKCWKMGVQWKQMNEKKNRKSGSFMYAQRSINHNEFLMPTWFEHGFDASRNLPSANLPIIL
ncbi:hypothetical protein PM082_004241 [Marasmius tenuissimus]|nr:hypothetical protein PM082_004241 [Marasmius tenuissimus]